MVHKLYYKDIVATACKMPCMGHYLIFFLLFYNYFIRCGPCMAFNADASRDTLGHSLMNDLTEFNYPATINIKDKKD